MAIEPLGAVEGPSVTSFVAASAIEIAAAAAAAAASAREWLAGLSVAETVNLAVNL